MIIIKITQGWVEQRFDTETGEFIDQEFTAGDEVEYKSGDTGETTEPFSEYLPFDMVQPKDIRGPFVQPRPDIV